MKIHPKDEKYVPVDADPDFDPEHNRRVIQSVIDDNERIARRKRRENEQGIRERANAVARYLKSLDMGKGESNLVKYFGKRELARLRGEDVLSRLKDGLTVYDRNGKILRRPDA